MDDVDDEVLLLQHILHEEHERHDNDMQEAHKVHRLDLITLQHEDEVLELYEPM